MSKEQGVVTKEFKIEAVRLAQTSDRSLTQLARELGIKDAGEKCQHVVASCVLSSDASVCMNSSLVGRRRTQVKLLV